MRDEDAERFEIYAGEGDDRKLVATAGSMEAARYAVAVLKGEGEFENVHPEIVDTGSESPV